MRAGVVHLMSKLLKMTKEMPLPAVKCLIWVQNAAVAGAEPTVADVAAVALAALLSFLPAAVAAVAE